MSRGDHTEAAACECAFRGVSRGLHSEPASPLGDRFTPGNTIPQFGRWHRQQSK
jgi:hypothetical protein